METDEVVYNLINRKHQHSFVGAFLYPRRCIVRDNRISNNATLRTNCSYKYFSDMAPTLSRLKEHTITVFL